MSQAPPGLSSDWYERCDCGHLVVNHDVYEYRGDGTEMCCVVGCDQRGCPGRRALVGPGAGQLKEDA